MAFTPCETYTWPPVEKEPKEDAYSRALQSAGMRAIVAPTFYDLKEQYYRVKNGQRDNGVWFNMKSLTTVAAEWVYADLERYVIHDAIVEDDEIQF